MPETFYEIIQPNNFTRKVQVFENLISGEPVETKTVVLVDQFGQPLSAFRSAQSGPWNVNQGLATTLVNAWPVELTDGVNLLGTSANPIFAELASSPGITIGQVSQGQPGSIPWPVVFSDPPSVRVLFNEVPAVQPGIETPIITATAPSGGLRIKTVKASGDNVAKYRLNVDGTTIGIARSSFTSPNVLFDLNTGFTVAAGHVLEVTCIHSRPTPGDFDATIIVGA